MSIQENIAAIVLVVYSDPNITGRCEIIWSFLAKTSSNAGDYTDT